MDVIPVVQFVASLVSFGLLMYVYDPIITYLREMYQPAVNFPAIAVYANAIFFLWASLAAVVMLSSGIRLIMKMQQQRGGSL